MLPVSPDRIFFCDFSPKALYFCCKKIASKIGKHSTIAHTHFIDFLHLLAVKLCFRHNVCHYHMAAPDNNTIKRKIRKIVCNIIYFKSIIIGVSEPVTSKLHSYFKFSKCECITNAIDFDSLDSYSSGSSKSAPSDPEKFRLLIHGSHFIRKGVDLAIQAVEQINLNHPIKCSLLITAHPTSVAEELVNQYAPNSNNIQVMDVIRDVKDLYDSVDAFISPSRSEAFAYAVAESSYCNCQVIASDVPGQNTMKDIPGIIWVEPNSVQSITNAILDAIDRKSSPDLAEINRKQKEYVTKNYGIDTWVARNMEIYRNYF